MNQTGFTRRHFLGATAAGAVATLAALSKSAEGAKKKAQIAITFDLEMSRHYPKRGMLEWDYQKGNLDDATKSYSVEAAKIVKKMGGKIHFFCVGRVLEHASVDWLKEIAADGHPIGNHTYDHVNVLAKKPEDVQFRFKRSPWLVKGRTAEEVIRDNIQVTTLAMKQRAGIDANGFRTPGGFNSGLGDRPDIQKVLLDQGFKWASCKYPRFYPGKPKEAPTDEIYNNIVRAQAEAQPYRYASGLVEIPMSPISDVNAFRSLFWKRGHFLKAVRLAVERAIEHREVYDFLCHPSCMVVEDPQHETIKMICELVNNSKDKAEIVGLDKIASSV
jgi:peptidoglycan/xylan/chitin deacetylase (PgdA/CDA1 family)